MFFFHCQGSNINIQCYCKHNPLLRFMETTHEELGVTPTESPLSLYSLLEETFRCHQNTYHSYFSAWRNKATSPTPASQRGSKEAPLLKQTAPETRSNWMGCYCSLQLKTLSSLVAEVVWSAHSPLNSYSINILCQRHVPFHRRKARHLHRNCITCILHCRYSHPLPGAQDHIPLGSRVLVQSPCPTTLQMKRWENSFFLLSKNISFFCNIVSL